MPESLHLKFERQEAIYGKKQVLLLQTGILKLSNHLKNIVEIKKKKIALRNKLRLSFSQMNKEVSSLMNQLPEVEKKAEPKKVSSEKKSMILTKEISVNPEEIISQNKRQNEIEKEINKIRAKLAELG